MPKVVRYTWPNEDLEHTACSKCGGERDSEGWCAKYCEDDCEVILHKASEKVGSKKSQVC